MLVQDQGRVAQFTVDASTNALAVQEGQVLDKPPVVKLFHNGATN